MVEADFPGASNSSGLEDASGIFGLLFSYPEDSAVFPDNLLLLIPVSITECLINKDNPALHVGDIDAIVGAHNSA